MNILLISGNQNGVCELCGKSAELRPYGPNGESICFECGMKDEETTLKQFEKLLDAHHLTIINVTQDTTKNERKDENNEQQTAT